MSKVSVRMVAMMLTVLAAVACRAGSGAAVPSPAADEARATAAGKQTAVVAGGCFWGIQAVFQHVKGVVNATSGYSGGSAKTADYETVSGGRTGHAESVEIVYDPAQITYGELLRIFFSVAHDPTELNRQGPDTGTQYRSEIFFADESQQKTALAYIAQLDQAHVFGHPIVTRVDPLKGFFPAEGYHQDFLVRNPTYPYIVYNDLPKIANLQRQLPDIYIDKPVLAAAAR